MQSTPEKGRGLIARLNIAKGTRIIIEKPLFTLFSTADTLDQNILAKVKALSKDQHLSLHNNFRGQNILNGIYKINALPCGSDSPVGGVYPTICLINHACAPNAHTIGIAQQ